MKRDELSERERKAFLKAITTTSPEDVRERVALVVVGIVGVVFAGADIALVAWAGLGGLNRGVAMLIIVEFAAIGGLYRLMTRTKR